MTPAISDLAARFSGQLLQPADAGYDEARRVHNGLIDKRPTLVARCRNVADIVDAVNLAHESNLESAVKGGGHNVAGRATIDGGLLIDLSLMKGIHVDPTRRTVRVQGGATWAEYNRETQAHGLASTGGTVSATGVAGLTLGGGLGWLVPKYGLAIDNLRSAQIVTADGRVLTASDDENEDLFWAIRGGGGNFGVAASFEFAVHPVGPVVIGGLVAHPFASAGDVLRVFRDATAALPDELMLFGGLVHAPDGSGVKLAAIAACHCGSRADGEQAVRAVKAYGKPAMDALGPIPYATMNTLLDAGFPRGALNYWKSSFLSFLSNDAIDTLVDCFGRVPSPMSLVGVEHMHGAGTRVGPDATAFPHRARGFNLLVISQWMNPADSDANIAWGRETYAAMRPYMGAGRYVNYMGADEGDNAAAAAYGPNYDRLRRLKAKYDPTNFFRQNLNIRPA
jgi:FAD/FMN-containing dehydrogenase